MGARARRQNNTGVGCFCCLILVVVRYCAMMNVTQWREVLFMTTIVHQIRSGMVTLGTIVACGLVAVANRWLVVSGEW